MGKSTKYKLEDVAKTVQYNPETGEYRYLVRTNCPSQTLGNGKWTEWKTVKKSDNYKRYGYVAGHSIHRIAWYLVTGDNSVGLEIDHIDGDPSNNRFCNLRKVDRTTNSQNVKTKTRTGHRFVYGPYGRGGWLVNVGGPKNGPGYIGYFQTLEEALEARNKTDYWKMGSELRKKLE